MGHVRDQVVLLSAVLLDCGLLRFDTIHHITQQPFDRVRYVSTLHSTFLFVSRQIKITSKPRLRKLIGKLYSLQRSSRADDSNFTHTPSIRKQNHKQHETKFGTKRESTGGEHSCSAALSACRNTSFCLSRHTSRTLRDYVVGVENRENTGHQAA